MMVQLLINQSIKTWIYIAPLKQKFTKAPVTSRCTHDLRQDLKPCLPMALFFSLHWPWAPQLQMNRQTDRLHYDANSRSYCASVYTHTLTGDMQLLAYIIYHHISW